jgi:tetratricopeptide (TPR) repeat protein
MGRFDESLAESLQALAIDPLDTGMTFHLGFHYYNSRQYEQAIAQLQRALEMNHNHNDAHAILGLVYEQQRQYPEAIREMQKSVELGGVDNRGPLGHMYAMSGDRAAAQMLLEQLKEESKHRTVSAYHIARIYAGLADKEQAFAWLEKAFVEHDGNFTSPGVKVDQMLENLHGDPRFVDLLRRMSIPQ